MTKQIQLQTWDLDEQFKVDSMIIYLGKRRFGKTTKCRDLLSRTWQFYPDGGYVFTGTKHNYYWQQHFPETRIYEGFQPDVLQRILDEQMLKVERIRSGEKDIMPFVVIVLEDLASETELRYANLFKKLAMAGRHYFVNVHYLTQDIKSVGPDIRGNADVVMFTYQSQKRTIQAIEEDWASLFHGDVDVNTLVQENTQDYQMLVVDQTEARHDWSEAFFVTTSDPEPAPFRVGDAQFWKNSGCNWREQLRKFANMPKKKTAEWRELANKRWERDARDRANGGDPADDGEPQLLEVNGIWAAPYETQVARMEEIRKRKRLGESEWDKALQLVSDPTKLWKYVPEQRLDPVWQGMFDY